MNTVKTSKESLTEKLLLAATLGHSEVVHLLKQYGATI